MTKTFIIILLLITLLITIFVAVILFIHNLRLEKKVKSKTAKLTDTLIKLKENEEKIKNFLVNLHVGVAVFSAKGEVLISNRKFFELGGAQNQQDKGKPLIEQSIVEQSFIEHPNKLPLEEIIEHYINEDGQKLTMKEFPIFKVISTGKPSRDQIIGITNPDNGNVKWILGDHEPGFDESGKLSKIIVTLIDVTARKNAEDKLYNMSIHDTSTGLYNRNYFEGILDKYNNKDTTGVGIVISDLDGLKLIDDTLGHAVGDDYIKTSANILCECFSQNGVVARIGGDEFAVLIEHTTTAELSAILLKIDKILNIINSEEHIVPFSMSLGYAIGDDKQKDLRELLKMADNLMYREKLHHKQSKMSKCIDN